MTSDAGSWPEDLIRLGHMLEASEWALSIATGRARQELDQDLELFLALAKAVEIVGEAASKVSEATRSQAPGIPWGRAIGMRHRLVHDYNAIRLTVLWETVQEDLPPLIDSVRALLPDGFIPIPIRLRPDGPPPR